MEGRLAKPRGVYDFQLTLAAAIEARQTGRFPTPEEMAHKPMQWQIEVSQQMELIEWQLALLQKLPGANGQS